MQTEGPGSPSKVLQLERQEPLHGFTSQPPSLSSSKNTAPLAEGWGRFLLPAARLSNPSGFSAPVHFRFRPPFLSSCRQGATESSKSGFRTPAGSNPQNLGDIFTIILPILLLYPSCLFHKPHTLFTWKAEECQNYMSALKPQGAKLKSKMGSRV